MNNIPKICVQNEKSVLQEGDHTECELNRYDKKEDVQTRPSSNNLGIFCSPRMSRRRSKSSDNLLPFKKERSSEMCWLSPLDINNSQLQRSVSKQFSDFSGSDLISLRSVSHMTLFGSLDRFLSADDLRSTKDLEWDGRDTHLDQTMRYSSVPEQQMRELHNLIQPPVSRSYSSIRLNGSTLTPTINYDKLEEKLPLEDTDIEAEQIFTGPKNSSNNTGYSSYLQNVLLEKGLHTADDETFKNYRIQSWLEDVSTLNKQ